jgi:glycosyltransferase involved in cell wall biosynthesis
MPAISVIVPIYNVEKYLCKCLDSILAQTFTDYELLLIDDGSLDRSGQICDEYAIKDYRISVFHKENGGVSSARNLGLDNAKGKWIAFIDSDDWVDTTYLEHLLEGDEDVELRGMGLMMQLHKQKWRKQVTHKKLFLMGNLGKFYQLYMNDSLMRSPYVKLFLLSIINKANIRYDTCLQLWEDALFNLQYLNKVKSISIKNYAEYYYRNTESSLSKNVSLEKYEKVIKAYEKVKFSILTDKNSIDAINILIIIHRLSIFIIQIEQLYIHQNLKPIERRKCLSQIFIKLNSIGFNWFPYLLSLPTKRRCLICLSRIPIVFADVILLFLFLFWSKIKNN